MKFQCLNCGYEFENSKAEKEHFLPVCPECGEIIEALIDNI